MPNVSGSTTQIATSVGSIAELMGEPTSQFKTGDFASIESGNSIAPLYMLLSQCDLPADGINVVYTRETNPATGGSGKGRWALYSTGAAGAGAGNVIYRQNAPVVGGNVYGSFAAAYAASTEGSIIFIDSTYGAPVIGPVGAVYDMTLRSLAGTLDINTGGSGGGTVVGILDKVRLPGLNRVYGVLQLTSQSTQPIIDTPYPLGDPTPILILSEGSSIFGSTSAPFIDVPASGNAFFIVLQLGGQIGDGTSVAISVGGGSALKIIGNNQGALNDNALSGPLTASASIEIDDVATQYSLVQPLFLGSLSIDTETTAENLGYSTDSRDALWNEPAFVAPQPSPGPVVQDAISNLVRREQVFVFRPGGVAAGMIFTDWNLLLSAIQQTQNAGFPIIEMDESALPPGANITFPLGTTILPVNVEIRGNGGFGDSPTALQFGDGVNAANDTGWILPTGITFRDVALYNRNVSSAPLQTDGGPGISYLATFLGIGGLFDGLPGGPATTMFSVSGAVFDAKFLGSWNIAGNVGRSIFSADSTLVKILLAHDSVIFANTLESANSIVVTVEDEALCSFVQVPPITNPNAAGALITYNIGGTYSELFTEASLVGSILTVTHNLGTSIPFVTLVDNTGVVQASNTTRVIDSNTLSVDVATYEPLIGSWSIGVKR